jgi:hypothetical protein
MMHQEIALKMAKAAKKSYKITEGVSWKSGGTDQGD